MEEAKGNNVFTASTWEALESQGLDPCPAVMETRGGGLSLHILGRGMFSEQ